MGAKSSCRKQRRRPASTTWRSSCSGCRWVKSASSLGTIGAYQLRSMTTRPLVASKLSTMRVRSCALYVTADPSASTPRRSSQRFSGPPSTAEVLSVGMYAEMAVDVVGTWASWAAWKNGPVLRATSCSNIAKVMVIGGPSPACSSAGRKGGVRSQRGVATAGDLDAVVVQRGRRQPAQVGHDRAAARGGRRVLIRAVARGCAVVDHHARAGLVDGPVDGRRGCPDRTDRRRADGGTHQRCLAVGDQPPHKGLVGQVGLVALTVVGRSGG